MCMSLREGVKLQLLYVSEPKLGAVRASTSAMAGEHIAIILDIWIDVRCKKSW